MKPMNFLRWIESDGAESSEDATKFLPLPGGEGRGEGERKHNYTRIFRTNRGSIILNPCEK